MGTRRIEKAIIHSATKFDSENVDSGPKKTTKAENHREKDTKNTGVSLVTNT
jgi:hypothetical protein